MKAILIARVSTEEQKEAGNSLPAQVTRLENYCQSKGFEILKSCSFDESAYKSQRDEFDRIIDFILSQTEKVAVCCDKVDRLSRNIFDKRVAQLYEKALNDEIELHFTSEGQVINSRISAAEKFQFSISLGLAKYYSDAISDNVKRAQEQKLRKGEWLSKAPFGYKNIRLENGHSDIVIDEHNANIVRTVFELYATGAYSTQLLCAKIKTDFNIKWPKGYLGKLLRNPFFCGAMIVKNKTYQHRYQPIISKSLFEEVQQIMDGFKKKSFKYAGLPFFYRGLIRCGECGLSISPERHKGYVYYHCTEYKGKHGAKWIREDAITKQLGQVFKSLQVPLKFHQQIIETLKSVHQDKVKFHNNLFTTLTDEHRNLTAMMDNLYLDKLKGKISEEQYDKFYESFSTQKSDISIRLNQLSEAEDNYYSTAKCVLELTNQAYDLFVSSEVEERRQLITLVLQNLRLNGENIVYDARKPFDAMIKSANNNNWRS
jgi:DNA invertase Pin-like site-specific DNA recombinase